MEKYLLITTQNCPSCNRVKNLIKSQNLNIEIQMLNEENEYLVEKAKEKDFFSFPILCKNEEPVSFGEKAGFYILDKNIGL